MKDYFFNHLNKYVQVSENDFQRILSYVEQHEIKKKENLIEAGNYCRSNYFVLEGCLQMFFISNAGNERTIQFAIEGWWMTDYLAYYHQAKTEFYIQAVEDTIILTISSEHQAKLLRAFPQLEKYFRIIYQISYGAALKRMQHIYNLSKEESYFNFISQFPEFAQRVPQYLIASFLGLTPEYVSMIRNKRRS